MPVCGVITGYEDIMWGGKYSEVRPSGSVVAYVKDVISRHPKDAMIACLQVDGIVRDPMHPTHYLHLEKELDGLFPVAPGTKVLYLALCTRDVKRKDILCLPLDDECFNIGVTQKVLSEAIRPMWSDRRPMAFWRGLASGAEFPNLRVNVVEKLLDVPHADCRLTENRTFAPPDSPFAHMTDPKRFALHVDLQEHLRYKYILIIDGVCIASSHQWVFASGSVPIMVTHPGNEYWFKRYLEPMVNYVPVAYDLSDLVSKIEWLVHHDDSARRIAENAAHLASTIFTPEFQRFHIEKEVQRLLQ